MTAINTTMAKTAASTAMQPQPSIDAQRANSMQ